jgi:hypothetical protein
MAHAFVKAGAFSESQTDGLASARVSIWVAIEAVATGVDLSDEW